MGRLIFETMSEVFETMFFVALEPLSLVPDGYNSDVPKSYVVAQVEFVCDNTGFVRIYFPLNLARSITINFLGVDASDVDQKRIKDAMGETVNMVMGSLLGKLDPQGLCMLGIPETVEIPKFVPSTILGNSKTCMFNTEQGVLFAVFGEKLTK